MGSDLIDIPKTLERSNDLETAARWRREVHGATNHVMGYGNVIFCIACNGKFAQKLAAESRA